MMRAFTEGSQPFRARRAALLASLKEATSAVAAPPAADSGGGSELVDIESSRLIETADAVDDLALLLRVRQLEVIPFSVSPRVSATPSSCFRNAGICASLPRRGSCTPCMHARTHTLSPHSLPHTSLSTHFSLHTLSLSTHFSPALSLSLPQLSAFTVMRPAQFAAFTLALYPAAPTMIGLADALEERVAAAGAARGRSPAMRSAAVAPAPN